MMGMKRYAILMILGAIAAVSWAIFKVSRFDAEQTPYEVLRTNGRFELRKYPILPVAVTPMGGSDDDDAFRRLFRFISGQNTRRQKIAMTTPVIFDGPPGEPQAMSFVLPTAATDMPDPLRSDVRLEQRPGQKVAVYRFAGRMGEKYERRGIEHLRSWMEEQGYTPEDEPFIAYYDAPIVPGFLRRNEVMWRMAAP